MLTSYTFTKSRPTSCATTKRYFTEQRTHHHMLCHCRKIRACIYMNGLRLCLCRRRWHHSCESRLYTRQYLSGDERERGSAKNEFRRRKWKRGHVFRNMCKQWGLFIKMATGCESRRWGHSQTRGRAGVTEMSESTVSAAWTPVLVLSTVIFYCRSLCQWSLGMDTKCAPSCGRRGLKTGRNH